MVQGSIRGMGADNASAIAAVIPMAGDSITPRPVSAALDRALVPRGPRTSDGSSIN